MFNAHRLVYETFVGSIPDGMQINHKNGIKDDNRPENLETMTSAENTQHAYRVLGLPGRKNPQPGETNGRAKVNWEVAREVRRLYASGGYSQQALAAIFLIDQTNISRIIRGDTWREQKLSH